MSLSPISSKPKTFTSSQTEERLTNQNIDCLFQDIWNIIFRLLSSRELADKRCVSKLWNKRISGNLNRRFCISYEYLFRYNETAWKARRDLEEMSGKHVDWEAACQKEISIDYCISNKIGKSQFKIARSDLPEYSEPSFLFKNLLVFANEEKVTLIDTKTGKIKSSEHLAIKMSEEFWTESFSESSFGIYDPSTSQWQVWGFCPKGTSQTECIKKTFDNVFFSQNQAIFAEHTKTETVIKVTFFDLLTKKEKSFEIETSEICHTPNFEHSMIHANHNYVPLDITTENGSFTALYGLKVSKFISLNWSKLLTLTENYAFLRKDKKIQIISNDGSIFFEFDSQYTEKFIAGDIHKDFLYIVNSDGTLSSISLKERRHSIVTLDKNAQISKARFIRKTQNLLIIHCPEIKDSLQRTFVLDLSSQKIRISKYSASSFLFSSDSFIAIKDVDDGFEVSEFFFQNDVQDEEWELKNLANISPSDE